MGWSSLIEGRDFIKDKVVWQVFFMAMIFLFGMTVGSWLERTKAEISRID